MNILYDLTKHLAIASKTLNVESKLISLGEEKPLQISPPMQSKETFTRPMAIQKPEINNIPSQISYPVQQSLPPNVPMAQPAFYLGNIQGFVQDPSINMIVCDGPMKFLKIKRQGRMEQTSVTLTRQEIDYVVNMFSRFSNSPLKPVFRARVSNMSLLALVSSMESRFMITLER